MSQGWEKFHAAMNTLTGSGSQKERLLKAYSYNLVHIKKNNVPADVWDELNQFSKDMTKIQVTGNGGSIKATVHEMNDLEVDSMVKKIIYMHDSVVRHESCV